MLSDRAWPSPSRSISIPPPPFIMTLGCHSRERRRSTPPLRAPFWPHASIILASKPLGAPQRPRQRPQSLSSRVLLVGVKPPRSSFYPNSDGVARVSVYWLPYG